MSDEPSRLGHWGTAPSTISGKDKTVFHLQGFLDRKNVNDVHKEYDIDISNLFKLKKSYDPEKLKEIEKVLCNITFFQELGYYLVEVAVNKYTKESLACGTILQYFSGIKEEIQSIWPNNETWIGHEFTNKVQGKKAWYGLIRISIEYEINRKMIEAGITVDNRVFPLGRISVANIVCFLFEQDTVESIENAIYILTDFMSIGRGSEAGYATYPQCWWNIVENVLYNEWNEIKTRKQMPINTYPDMITWKTDWYFIFWCYLLVGGGERHKASIEFNEEMKRRKNYCVDSLMFPGLAVKGATKISNCLQFCQGKVEGIPAVISDPNVRGGVRVTASGLRAGSHQECAINITCGREPAIFRGGWNNDRGAYQSRSIDYFTQCFELLNISGRALAGASNCRMHVHNTTLNSILPNFDEDRKEVFELFLKSQIMYHYGIITQGSLGHYLKNTCFSSFLRWLPQFTVDMKGKSLILTVFNEAVCKFKAHFTTDDIESWGNSVRLV